jgi:hypothetical protein
VTRETSLPTPRTISLGSPTEWREALVGIPHAFAHTWESCYSMHLTTGLSTFLSCFDQDGTRIVCPIAERTFRGAVDIVTPQGFSGFTGNGETPDFPRHWEQFVLDRGYVAGYLALNPLLERASYYRHAVRTNLLYFLDLTRSSRELLAAMDRNRRRQLRTFDECRAGLIVDRTSLTDFLVAQYRPFLDRVGASPAAYFSDETLRFLCGLDNVLMVGAGSDVIQAVYVFAHAGGIGECLFNVALSEGRRYAVPLLWWGVEQLQSTRVRVLGMGGGVREGDSVAESKERFGARTLPLHCLKQVYRRELYEELCRGAGVEAYDETGYFPPYRMAVTGTSVPADPASPRDVTRH